VGNWVQPGSKNGLHFLWGVHRYLLPQAGQDKSCTFGLQYPLGTNILGKQQQNGSAKYHLVISFRTELVNFKTLRTSILSSIFITNH
jgi:hypothetical protein